jgi:YesN/AraC family two-component response regulator
MDRELLVKLKEYRVLFVDDDELIVMLMNKMLKNLFKDVKIANNGEIGYSTYLDFKPDLVLTDINMPIVDGLSMSRNILNNNSSQKIIAITGHNDAKYTDELNSLGIPYVIKPVNREELYKKIFEILNIK